MLVLTKSVTRSQLVGKQGFGPIDRIELTVKSGDAADKSVIVTLAIGKEEFQTINRETQPGQHMSTQVRRILFGEV